MNIFLGFSLCLVAFPFSCSIFLERSQTHVGIKKAKILGVLVLVYWARKETEVFLKTTVESAQSSLDTSSSGPPYGLFCFLNFGMVFFYSSIIVWEVKQLVHLLLIFSFFSLIDHTHTHTQNERKKLPCNVIQIIYSAKLP